MTDMLTSMKQYNELVEEYKTKVLSRDKGTITRARIVILLFSPPRYISRILNILVYFFQARCLYNTLSSSPYLKHPVSRFRFGLFYLCCLVIHFASSKQ